MIHARVQVSRMLMQKLLQNYCWGILCWNGAMNDWEKRNRKFEKCVVPHHWCARHSAMGKKTTVKWALNLSSCKCLLLLDLLDYERIGSVFHSSPNICDTKIKWIKFTEINILVGIAHYVIHDSCIDFQNQTKKLSIAET